MTRTRRVLLRCIIVLLLVPGGFVFCAFPFLLVFAGDLGPQLRADIKGIMGAGEATTAYAHQVACVGEHYGTNRQRANEYQCTIFLTNSPLSQIERVCARNQSGQMPALRLLSSDPVEYAVSWGEAELISRLVFVLGFPSLFIFAFGFACLYVSVVGWNRSSQSRKAGSMDELR